MSKALSNMTSAEKLALINQVIATITPSPTAWGMTAGGVSQMSSAASDLSDAITAQTAASTASKAATAMKNTRDEVVENLLRAFRDTAKGHGVSDVDMTSTGMPLSSGEPTPPSATIPVASVDTSKRLEHTINWVEATTPDNKKRPKGAMGADIFVKIDGPPPTDQSECNFVTTDSATPYTVHYTGADAGKMAHYMIRWRMRDGSVGPWGETVSATVTG